MRLHCRRKPKVSVHGYARCAPGHAGRRNTQAERRHKSCVRGGRKHHVGGHKRRVCRS